MIRIVLVCAAGMSTSILVNNMRKLADPEDVIRAYPTVDLEPHVDDCDVILVSPAIRYQFEKIKEMAQFYGKKAALMELKAYTQMDGAKILTQAHELKSSQVEK